MHICTRIYKSISTPNIHFNRDKFVFIDYCNTGAHCDILTKSVPVDSRNAEKVR